MRGAHGRSLRRRLPPAAPLLPRSRRLHPPPLKNTRTHQTNTAAALVFERIDLLDDVGAVPELMQLVAHTCTARVVLQRWREGDLAARSRVSYPDGLLAWAQRTLSLIHI